MIKNPGISFICAVAFILSILAFGISLTNRSTSQGGSGQPPPNNVDCSKHSLEPPPISDMSTLELQTFLNDKGYVGKDGKELTLDGKMGPNTEYAKEQYMFDQYGIQYYVMAKGVE